MGSLPESQRFDVDTVCIIGAGPSGLAAAKYLLAESKFSRIVIFEQRTNPGGLWNYSSCPVVASQSVCIPQTDSNASVDELAWRNDKRAYGGSKQYEDLEFTSPIYDQLETNIPRGLMGFSDLDWPKDSQLFPRHETVLEYIEQYARDVGHLIQFRTRVLDVKLDESGKWAVKTQRLSPDRNEDPLKHTFDAVLVANGHFNIPFVPTVTGIEAWNEKYPGSIIHSKFYRSSTHYAGKKTIVVGNSASGVDIGAQIARTCKLPLLQSERSESYLQPDSSSSVQPKPEIIEYIPEDRSVRFQDGTLELNIDAIVYCTGYFYSFPFLGSLDPPAVTSGLRVENTYQHVFYRPNPTLAFGVLNQKVIPFPMAEVQGAVIARVWSGRLELPSEDEMTEWERKIMKEAGTEKDFHLLKFPKDADYINMMHDWAMSADRRSPGTAQDGVQPTIRDHQRHHPNGDHHAVGKVPPYWGVKEYWTRERFPAIKKAFQSFGDKRHTKRTLEDVGFDFVAQKSSQGR